MRKIKTTAALLLFGCSLICLAADSSSTNKVLTIEQAYAQLLSVERFAFGGTGRAGIESEGSTAFRTIAGSTNAMNLFESILRNGKPAGQLYALAGLRKLDPDNFSHYERLISAESKVETMHGCIVEEEKASDVVARIRHGDYLKYWPGEQVKKKPR